MREGRGEHAESAIYAAPGEPQLTLYEAVGGPSCRLPGPVPLPTGLPQTALHGARSSPPERAPSFCADRTADCSTTKQFDVGTVLDETRPAMSFAVRIAPADASVAVEMGETILEA